VLVLVLVLVLLLVPQSGGSSDDGGKTNSWDKPAPKAGSAERSVGACGSGATGIGSDAGGGDGAAGMNFGAGSGVGTDAGDVWSTGCAGAIFSIRGAGGT
jgi:hypothetical protein